MSKIEDVMYEAYKMGVNETVINRVGELKLKEGEIQSDCKHTNFTIKYIQEIKSPKRVCDNCNKDIGYANDKELKDSGFM